ncbi:hypothetical protein ACOMHN_020997 [Nucella lapillus]
MSQKSERHRRSWRRSEKSNRRSSSLSSSSSSSSASSKSPLPPDRRTTTVNKLDSSGASGHARDRSSAASESAHLVSQTMTGSLSPRNDQDTKPEPKSPSESRKEEPVSSTVVSAPESSARGGASDAASDSLLVSAGYAAITSYTSDDDGAITEMKTNTDSKSASESVGTAASSTVTDDVTPTTSGSNQETCSAGESVSSTMDKAAIGETVSETIPLFPSVSRTQIRFYFTRKAPSFSFAVPLKEETSKAVNETDDPKESGSKENPKAKKEPDLHSFKECRSTAEELRPALQSEDSAEASETCKQPLPSATENDMMEVPEVDLIDISDVCSDVRLSHSLDDIENETEEAMLETNKGKEILQQNKSLLKSVADSSKAAMQTPVTESTDTRCGESELTCSGIAVKLGRKCTETLTPNEISEKTPNNPMEEETLNVSPTYCQDHSKGYRETGDQGNKVLAASHSAPTTRACEADSGAETAGGSKGRRALLPTPKPALLPIPSALHGERAAAECPAVQGTRPTLLTSPPHSNYSKLAHIARSGRAGRDPYQSSEHPHPQSVRLKRISANTERENTSVFKPQGNTFQNRNRTSEDKKQMENLGSETFDQEKTPTHDRSPGVADKRHADENSQQNDAVNTKQRTMETPSRDHSDSDSDTERPSKPKLKSKILLAFPSPPHPISGLPIPSPPQSQAFPSPPHPYLRPSPPLPTPISGVPLPSPISGLSIPSPPLSRAFPSPPHPYLRPFHPLPTPISGLPLPSPISGLSIPSPPISRAFPSPPLPTPISGLPIPSPPLSQAFPSPPHPYLRPSPPHPYLRPSHPLPTPISGLPIPSPPLSQAFPSPPHPYLRPSHPLPTPISGLPIP